MNGTTNWIAVAWLMGTLVGCGRAPVPAPTAPAASNAAEINAAANDFEPTRGTVDSPAQSNIELGSAPEAEDTNAIGSSEIQADDHARAASGDPDEPSLAASTQSPTLADTVPASDPPAPAERIMLLTPSGPLLVDLHITIEGEPYADKFDHVVADVMAIADEDQNGRVSWTDLIRHPRFRAGQFGNPPTTSYQAQQDMIRLYDTTKNKHVDPDELVRYLTSNRRTSRALALYTSNYRRTQNRDESPIRKWLDVNDDLVLDDTEIATAGRRLRLRDNDDDEILRPGDFLDYAAMQNGMSMRRPRDSEYLPKVGWQIKDGEPWSDMRVAWNYYYSVGEDLRADDLLIGDALYRKMDVDKNDSLDKIEMEMLLDVDAHLALQIELVPRADDTPVIELIAMRLPSDEISALVQHQPNRMTIDTPQFALDIFATDAVGDQQYDEQATNYLRQADADGNNYLSEDEFGAVAQFLNVEFEAADVDQDGKLFPDEITTLLGQRNLINRHQIRIRADDQDDALLPTIDLNSDGRIDSRELDRVSETLLSLDRNGDGQLQLHELRGTMMLGVVRGGVGDVIQANDPTFQVPSVVREASDAAPRWFKGMDRNRDATISWREFLGTRQQFDDMDQDQDGFLILEEATAE